MAAVRVFNQTLDPGSRMAGSLTCVLPLAHAPARFMAVTAAHVVAPLVASGQAGPSSGDQIVLEAGSRTFGGTLWFWCDLQRRDAGFTNELDAALVEVNAADAAALRAALGQPPTWSEAVANDSVRFEGFVSQASGRYTGQQASSAALYGVLGGLPVGVAFKRTLCADMPSRQGDSGSLVTSNGRAVGQLIIGEGEQSRFLPLEPLLEAFGLDWPRDATAPPSPSPQPPPPSQITVPTSVIGNDSGLAEDTLARTLWGEARGEPLAGIRAVAAVVMNRAMHPRVHWWGRTVIGVCRAPFQFSCWNADDPNRPRLLAATTADRHFQACLGVAQEALAGQLAAEQSLRATHYHTKAILPKWARNHVPCASIGAHLFYNDIE